MELVAHALHAGTVSDNLQDTAEQHQDGEVGAGPLESEHEGVGHCSKSEEDGEGGVGMIIELVAVQAGFAGGMHIGRRCTDSSEEAYIFRASLEGVHLPISE